jgi:hypothetical protein
MDFQHAIAEVQNPVIRDSRAGVCRGFAAAGEGQARLRDLQMSAGRVGCSAA